ncbi:hypothetical protein CKO28_09240 [Rhodovibrio sodomensis]|uniref:Response regulatory domain-containing protein n=1 Tax=Rhodovibrio sodomensis TaxID=1088 RepID=A0ABS1DCN9_9PROT|nr:response regulator [Rhodovibrio sodomensis]MBK1668221.1 hypothetical protein [Rhodovibrio sodomensis]
MTTPTPGRSAPDPTRRVWPVPGRGPGRLGRVLLVADDPLSPSRLAAVLRRAGFFVLVAQSGRHALREICMRGFELVITDVVVQDLDGLELLRWLRRLHGGIPAIALSGAGPDAGALYAKAAQCIGADVTLPKPAEPASVLAAAHRLTARPGPGRSWGAPAPADAPVSAT